MKPISLTCQILSVKNAGNSYIQFHVQIQNNSGGGGEEEICILFKTNMILGILLNQKITVTQTLMKKGTSFHALYHKFHNDFLHWFSFWTRVWFLSLEQCEATRHLLPAFLTSYIPTFTDIERTS
jgi:hypothetical protein